MSLPHFASFPDAQVRKTIPPQDWQIYLDSWVSLTDLYLQLGDQRFLTSIADNDDLTTFILTFFHEHAQDTHPSPQVHALRKRCFYLLHRLLTRVDTPKALLAWTALADFCHVYPRSERFRALLHEAWSRNASVIERSLQLAKTSLTHNLESKRPEEAENTLNRIAPLLKVSLDASTYMLTGSDFLDALYFAYPNVTSSIQKKLTTVAYLGLTALLEGLRPKYSLLSDHLYGLKSNEEQEQKKAPGKKTLVADLITNTPLLERIRDRSAAPEATRVKNTAASLSAFRQSEVARPKRLIRRKVDKGKTKAANDDFGHGVFTGQVHVHRMSMITQIQDLFPDLGAGFIVKLLDEYNENIEQVTAHLLEDSLPPRLANANRSEQL